MKPFIAKILIVAGLALAVSACVSEPPPTEPVVPTPPPVVEKTEKKVEEKTDVREEVYTGPTRGSVEEFRVRVGERVYFGTDMYNIDQDDMETLNRQAEWLKTYPNVNVLIAGNCDERGTREYNLALGARRANSVKEYLVARGISPDRIETISYGKERPLDGRSTEEAWEINRNAQTQIVSGAVS